MRTLYNPATDPTQSKWAGNQGYINSVVVRLYKEDRDKLVMYAKTLSEDQRNQARSHLKTVLKLQEAI